MDEQHAKLQHVFFLILFFSFIILLGFILWPFLSALVLAFSLSVVFRPVYEWAIRLCRGKESFAALLTVFFIFIVVLIPFIIVGSILFQEANNLYQTIAFNPGSVLNNSYILERYIQSIVPYAHVDLAEYSRYILQWMVSHLDLFFSQFFKVIVTLFVMIISLFYLLRDGRKLRRQFIRLSPLSKAFDENILYRLEIAIRSVLKGSVVIAIIQGILASVGVSFAGMSNPLIWGIFAMIASLIPGLGTAVVMVPAIIYLFFTGNAVSGVILLIWQLMVVGLIDNFLAPILIERGMKIHPLLILLSVLGGIGFFGPIGFILGPLILAFFFALLEMYPQIVSLPNEQ
jgi:predicted PurR-regulated permease PerM